MAGTQDTSTVDTFTKNEFQNTQQSQGHTHGVRFSV